MRRSNDDYMTLQTYESSGAGSGVSLFDIAVTLLVIISAIFNKHFVYYPVSLADICLLVAVCVILLQMLYNRSSLTVSSNAYLLLLLWFISPVGFLILQNTSHTVLDAQEFSKSFGKMTFYLFCYFMVYSYLQKTSRLFIEKILLNILLINAIIAVYVFVVMSAHLEFPYAFLWLGQRGTEATGFFGGSGYVRARGLFSEPAALGLFQSLGLAYVLFGIKVKTANMNWKHIIIIVSILMSFSISAYFIIILLLSFYLGSMKTGTAKKDTVRYTLYAFIAAASIIVVYWTMPDGTILDAKIAPRIIHVLHREDNSANVRLLGSWELAFFALNKSILWGSSLGNLDVLYQKTPTMDDVDPTGKSNNVFAYILGSLGPFGLLLFVLFVIKVIKNNMQLGLVFAGALFATGNLLDPSFWVFLSLYNLPAVSMPGLNNVYSTTI